MELLNDEHSSLEDHDAELKEKRLSIADRSELVQQAESFDKAAATLEVWISEKSISPLDAFDLLRVRANTDINFLRAGIRK